MIIKNNISLSPHPQHIFPNNPPLLHPQFDPLSSGILFPPLFGEATFLYDILCEFYFLCYNMYGYKK